MVGVVVDWSTEWWLTGQQTSCWEKGQWQGKQEVHLTAYKLPFIDHQAGGQTQLQIFCNVTIQNGIVLVIINVRGNSFKNQLLRPSNTNEMHTDLPTTTTGSACWEAPCLEGLPGSAPVGPLPAGESTGGMSAVTRSN